MASLYNQFKIITAAGRVFDIQSASTTLAAFKTEIASETVGFITADGSALIGIDLIKASIITLTPPENAPVLT